STSKLSSAVATGDHDGVTTALREGVDPNSYMPWNFGFALGKYERVPVLIVANEKCYADVVSILLEANASTEPSGDFWLTPLATATYWGRTPIVETLLAHGADVHAKDAKWGDLPIHLAAVNGHLMIVQILHAHGSPLDAVNNNKDTPLHCAASFGHISIAKWLAQQGVDILAVDWCRRTAADKSELNGNSELAEWLRTQDYTAIAAR
ncbi:unnamed protein product, partial [Meganyctiphanes norvegica]